VSISCDKDIVALPSKIEEFPAACQESKNHHPGVSLPSKVDEFPAPGRESKNHHPGAPSLSGQIAPKVSIYLATSPAPEPSGEAVALSSLLGVLSQIEAGTSRDNKIEAVDLGGGADR